MGRRILLCLLCATACFTFSAIAQERANSTGSSSSTATAPQGTPAAPSTTHTSATSKATPVHPPNGPCDWKAKEDFKRIAGDATSPRTSFRRG
jgi:hypothetical protein